MKKELEVFQSIQNAMNCEGYGANGFNRLTVITDSDIVKPLLQLLLDHNLVDPFNTPRNHPRMLCVRPIDNGFKIGVRCVVSTSYQEIIVAPAKPLGGQDNLEAKLSRFAYACRIGEDGNVEVFEGDPRGKKVAKVKNFYKLFETLRRESIIYAEQ